MVINHKVNSIIILTILGLVSLYFGIGGAVKNDIYNQISDKYDFSDTNKVLSSDGISYKNIASFRLDQEEFKYSVIFPWLDSTPEFIGTIFAACFFGMLGGVICILKDVAFKNKKIENIKYILIPILGFFTGLIVIGVSYIVPTILVTGENKLRPITLQFLSLFSGIYCLQFYNFISELISKRIFGAIKDN